MAMGEKIPGLLQNRRKPGVNDDSLRNRLLGLTGVFPFMRWCLRRWCRPRWCRPRRVAGPGWRPRCGPGWRPRGGPGWRPRGGPYWRRVAGPFGRPRGGLLLRPDAGPRCRGAAGPLLRSDAGPLLRPKAGTRLGSESPGGRSRSSCHRGPQGWRHRLDSLRRRYLPDRRLLFRSQLQQGPGRQRRTGDAPPYRPARLQ